MKIDWLKFKDVISSSMNCMEIGIVKSVDYENQLVAVELYKKDKLLKSGIPYASEKILLTGVPFVCLGGGVAGLEFPIRSGDDCVVFFNDTNFKPWQETKTSYIDIQDERHTRKSAIALVGVRSILDAKKDYSVLDVVLRNGDAAKIVVGTDNISIQVGTYAIIVTSAGVNISVVDEDGNPVMDLAQAMNQLFTALETAQNTANNPAFNGPTIQAITTAKENFNEVIK